MVCALLLIPALAAAWNRPAGQTNLWWPELSAHRLSRLTHAIRAGETLSGILSQYRVSAEEIGRWCEAIRRKMNPRRLAAGQQLTLSFEDGGLSELRYVLDGERHLVVRRNDGMDLEVEVEARPVDIRVVGARGVVGQSFYGAAKRAGVPDRIISAMADLLGWKIDFTTQVHAGDRFRVLYEQRFTPDGELLGPGRILAADFIGQARAAAAFLYEDESGESVYLDAQGQAVERTFLRYPLEFTRITSAFSYSRFHPILKRRRPHLGVDFAAPPGTPIRAIGGGKVRFAGWKGGFGRHVEIDHGDGFASAYSHLRGINVKRGSRVRQGETIGWLGQTGLATGPHLHFAIFDKGRYVNPMGLKDRHRPVQVSAKRFAVAHAELVHQLRAIPGGLNRAISSTPPIAVSAVAQVRHLGPVVLTL